MGARERLRYQGDRGVFRRVSAEVGERYAESPRQHAREVEVVDRAELNEQLPQALARRGLLQQRLVEPARGDELALDEQLTQAKRIAALLVGEPLDGRDRGDRRHGCHGRFGIPA